MSYNVKSILVSVIIPVRNEEKYITRCIESVLNQDIRKENLELILVDGDSEDKTLDIIKEFIKDYDFIKLYKNPQKTVQHGLNIAIKNSVGRYIVRMDAHSEYAKDYIFKCIEYLEKTGAENVGGPMIARGKSQIQKIIAAAYSSRFALGGGKFHNESYEGYADTVYLGAFKRETLLSVGLYDENLPRNEDDDLNFRIIKSGGKIFITPKIKSVYYPRKSYGELFKQYFEYGFWKVAVMKKHKKPARISQLIPMLFVVFMILFIGLSLVSKVARNIFAIVMVAYLMLNFYFSFKNPKLNSLFDRIRLVWIHFILHFAYGVGFLCGMFKLWKRKF